MNTITEIRYALDQPPDPAAPRREARYGPWSASFYHRIRHALTLAPEITAHVISMRRSIQQSGDRVQTTKVPPAPLNVASVDDADNLYRALTYWTGLFADELGVQAPNVMKRARRVDGQVEGFPAGVSAHVAHEAVRALTGWLTLWLDSIMHLAPSEIEAFGEETRDIFRLQARWPVEERPRYSNLPCPDYHHEPDEPGRIALYPPAHYGDDQIIKCDDCGRYFDPADYAHLLEVFAQQAEEQQRSLRARRHLTAKYARECLPRS